MSTITQTETQTDIRKVFEQFQADLQMLSVRTQAMEYEHAENCGDDVQLMAQERCLKHVHIQLRDSSGNLVRVHRYTVHRETLSSNQRPGGNGWPCLPNGTLRVIVSPSSRQKLDRLKESGKLKLHWSRSSLSTDYSGMRSDSHRTYSSQSYGLHRDSFVN